MEKSIFRQQPPAELREPRLPALRGRVVPKLLRAPRQQNLPAETIPTVRDHRLRRRSARRQFLHLQHIAAAATQIGTLPSRDETIHAIMRGDFHGWDLVPAILRLAAPATIATLHVATLGFNRKNSRELIELLDLGHITRVVFLASLYFARTSSAEFAALAAELRARRQVIAAARTHAKILALALTDGRAFVVESSANLRSCNNLEQFCMTESPELLDFHAAWIEETALAAAAQAAHESQAKGAEDPAPPRAARGRAGARTASPRMVRRGAR